MPGGGMPIGEPRPGGMPIGGPMGGLMPGGGPIIPAGKMQRGQGLEQPPASLLPFPGQGTSE